jgi:RHS repeat-associated protein
VLSLFLAALPWAAQAAPACSDSLLGLSDTLTVGERVTWIGSVRQTDAAPTCALPTLPSFPAPAGTQLVVTWGGTGSLDTSFHGSVLVHSGGILLVKPGAYRIGAFTVEWGSTVKVDTTGHSRDTTHAGVQLVVEGAVQWMDGFISAYPGLSDSLAGTRFAVYVSGSQTVTLGNGDQLRLQLIAPQSTVVLGDQTKVWGRVLGHGVVWNNDSWGKFAANGVKATWDSASTVVIQGPRRFWTNATSVAVSWTVNGVAQTTQTTEALPTEGPHWIKRTSGGGSDSVLAMVDRTAPVVQILSPVDGLVTNQTRIAVSWTADGVAHADSSSLVEGANTLTRSQTDSAGNTGSATVHVTRDTHIPVVVIVSPTDGLVTNQAVQAVQWTVDGVAQSSSQITLVEGTNTITRSFTSPAGNTGTSTIHVTLDTHPPVVQFLSPVDGATVNTSPITVRWSVDGVEQTPYSQVLVGGFNTLTKTVADAAGNVGTASIKVVLDTVPPDVKIISPADGLHTTASSVLLRWSIDGQEQAPVSLALQLGSNSIDKSATDSAGNVGTAQVVVVREAQVDTVSAGPEPVPSHIDPLLPPTFTQGISFLFNGPGAIQTDVDSGSLSKGATAVIRGQVFTRDGVPLQGVVVSVLDHDEWGSTRTRADGRYDMAVLAVGSVVMDFQRERFLPAQRTVQVRASDYSIAPDVRLVGLDPVSTSVAFGSTTVQTMVGSTTTDQDGSRTLFLVVPAGLQATMVDSNGEQSQPTSLTFRATEYTVGEHGPEAMPGILPPGVAYTYAVEFSADEAPGGEIYFDRPIPFYVENFLGFPTGIPVPLGSYDRDYAEWDPDQSGVVLKIVGIENGRAEVDVTGSGLAAPEDSLLASGWSVDELDRLGSRYQVGQSLWRVLLPHFTAWDANWGVSPPSDADSNQAEPELDVEDQDCCRDSGSILGIQDRSLGEAIAIPGTGEALVYSSDRTSGMNRFRHIKINVSGDSVPASLKAIELQVNAGGQVLKKTFPPNPGQSYDFTWDGNDAWGRPAHEVQASISVNYVYDGVYQSVPRFGYEGTGYAIGANRETNEFRFGQSHTYPLKGAAASSWEDGSRQSLNPLAGTVDLGTGGIRNAPTALGTTPIRTVATGLPDWSPDLRVGPDGSLWVATDRSQKVLHYSTDGTLLRTIPCPGCQVDEFAFLADGTLLIAQAWGDQGRDADILKMDTGTGAISVFSRHRSQPTWGVDVNGKDEALVTTPFSDKVYKETLGGASVVVAGGGRGVPTDGVSATSIDLYHPWVALWTSDTEFVIGSQGYIFRVDGEGRIWRLAGDGTAITSGDGGFARDAQVMNPCNITKIGNDLCFADGDANRIRCISPDGLIRTVAGTGVRGEGADGEDATQSDLSEPAGLSMGHDDWAYFCDVVNKRIRKIQIRNPFGSGSEVAIRDSKSSDIWVFDSLGRHVLTRSSFTGDTLRAFTYDDQGRTIQIRNRTDTTRIEYLGDRTVRYTGSPGSDGQPRVTTVNKDAGGNVTSVVQPDGKVHAFTYRSGGLLESYRKPNGRISHFQYDSLGSLVSDADGDAPAQTISESKNGDTSHIVHRDAAGATTEYIQNKTSVATYRHQVVNGAVGPLSVIYNNGDLGSVESDGTTTRATAIADPQWGMAAPLYDEIRKLPNGDSTVVRHRAWIATADPNNPSSLPRRVDTTQVGAAVFLTDWNPQTRVQVNTDPAGLVTTSQFDARERLVQQIRPSGDTFKIVYDDAHHQELWLQQGRTTQVWKNGDGQVDSVRTNDGDTLRYVRDDDQQPTNVPQPGGSNVGLRWDDRGRLVGLTPAGRPEHQFLYTSWGGDSLYLPPSLGNTQGQVGYDYDNVGRLAKVRYSSQDSIVADFDAQSRWSNLNFGAGSVSFQYQGNSDLFSQGTRTNTDGTTESLAITSYGGEVYGETWTGQVSGAVSRTKDLQGNLGVLTVAGTPIAYSWLLGGQISAAGDATYTTGLLYGNLQLMNLGSLQDSYTYDQFGYGSLIADTTKVRGARIYVQDLTYDASGRIAGKTEIVNGDQVVWAYGYTNGRLTSVTQNGVVVGTYGWDANGNRAGSLVDAQDRLIQQGDATWTYDALWNLISATGPQNISYVVDPRGRRVGRKVNGTLVQGFLYGNEVEIVAELDGSGNVVSRFVYGSRPQVPDYMVKGGVNYRLVTDHLGSVRLVVDASTGSVVSKIDYDVWGNITSSQNLSFQPFGFAGGLRDDATGLVRFGARDYDPHVGRWTGKDPTGFNGGGANLYGYSFVDPVNYIDMNGSAAYLVNRTLGGNLAQPTFQPFSHTFVFTTNSDGSVDNTYSWGNSANPNGWNKNQLEDLTAAQTAVNFPWWAGTQVGGDDLDPYIEQAYSLMIDPIFMHPNGVVANNCKSEANNLIELAKALKRLGL